MFFSLKNKLIYLGAMVALLTGCAATNSMLGGNSRKDALAEMELSYAKNGVIIDVSSSDRLNEYDGEAHTLVIGVVQMADAAQFYKLISNPSSLSDALESDRGKAQFLQLLRFVVSPGKCVRFMLDRVQNAKYVGIITGYYSIDQQNSSRLFPVKIKVSSKGLIAQKYSASPEKLMIKINLGAKEIIDAVSENADMFVHCSNEINPDNEAANEAVNDAANDADKSPACCNYTIQSLQDKIID